MAKDTDELQFDLELETNPEAIFVQLRNAIFNYLPYNDLDKNDPEHVRLFPKIKKSEKHTFPTKDIQK